MEFEIPNYKVPSTNKMYAGRHWTKRKAEADLIHNLVFAHTRGIKPIKDFPVDIKIIAHYKHKRRRDSGNCSNKELIDGLVMSKIIPDDDTRYVRDVTTRAVIGIEDKVIINVSKVSTDG